MSLTKPHLPLSPLLLGAFLVSCQGLHPATRNNPAEVRPLDSSFRSQEEADDLDGMDPDGRIPKVELPADLPNPERWRYKPAARIQEGNVFERLFATSFITPLIFFSSEVGTGAGFAVTDIDFRNKRRQEFANSTFTYTTEGQQQYTLLWRRWLDHLDLAEGGIIQEERSFVQAFAGYRKTLTSRFYGLGADSQEDDETSYTDEVTALEAELDQAFPTAGSDWVAGAGVRLEHRNLSNGFVSGAGNTADVFPGLYQQGDDLDSLWLSTHIRHDTRDSQTNPYRGTMLQAWGRGTPWMTGGLAGITYGLRGSAIIPLPDLLHSGGDSFEENPPTDRLALGFSVEDTGGDLPFWALPTLGGSERLRGYIAGRFVDRSLWFAAAEYRLVVIPRGFAINERIRMERIGLALFYELGSVAGDLSELGSSRVLTSYGLGARFNLERAATFRADFGFAPDSTNLAITFGLSF
jgi:hypothetical protein